MKNNKKKIKIEIQRTNGKTFLSFEVDTLLEKVFKRQKKEIKTSVKWKGLKFYYIPTLIENKDYKDLLYKYYLFDDYGKELFDNGNFNIAFIRTVGGKGKIRIQNDIAFAKVSVGVKNIIDFLKEYYEKFLKDYKVKGYISFEV